MINAEIDRMLQEEENTMAETLYDKYMADPEFAAMMKHEDEVMMLTERIAGLEAHLSDIAEAHEQVLSEKCPSNEVHCTCVPYLRQEIKDLNAENSKIKELLVSAIEQCKAHQENTNEVYERLNECAQIATAEKRKRLRVEAQLAELREALIAAYNARFALCLNGDPDDPPTDPLSYDEMLQKWRALIGDDPAPPVHDERIGTWT